MNGRVDARAMRVPGATVDRVRGVVRRGRPPAPGKMLRVRSARVHVQVRGEGPTVVYIPDPPNGLDSVAPLLDRLAARYRVVAFELPGFGWSRGRPGFGYWLEDHARVLEEVLDATGTPRATIVAPCLAGFVALAFLRDHPERVQRLVLPQVPDWQAAQDWADRVDRRRRLRRPWLGQTLTAFLQDLIATRWYHVAEPDPVRRMALLRTFRERPRAGRLFSIASGLIALDAEDPLPSKPVGVPTLLLWGEADRSHPAWHAHTLSARFEKATCRTVPGGHFPDLADPDLLMAWLEAHPPDRSTPQRPSDS